MQVSNYITQLTKMSTATKQITFASGTKKENYGAIKKARPIVRTLVKRKAINGEEWYLNGVGQIHGPYNGQTMRHWLETNQIGPSAEVRMGDIGEFADIIEHFPNLDEAFCVPSQLCIHFLSIGMLGTRFKCVHKTERETNLSIEEVIDRFLLMPTDKRCKRTTEVWIGEYYLGKLEDIGLSIVEWNMIELEKIMDA